VHGTAKLPKPKLLDAMSTEEQLLRDLSNPTEWTANAHVVHGTVLAAQLLLKLWPTTETHFPLLPPIPQTLFLLTELH
jgi:hypothetical protein